MDIIRLSNGTTADNIDLYYDVTGAGFQLLADGMVFGIPEHQMLWHSSDYQSGDTIIREKVGNRTFPLRLVLDSNSDDDEIGNQLTALNRMTRQAREYQRGENVSRVYLQIQLDGATNWTRFDVKDITVNTADIFNYYNRKTGTGIKFGDGISMTITTAPWGYGAAETLANEIGTPHFQEDGNDDGLADEWTESGAPTTAIESTIYLCGSQSQKVTCDNAGTDGIYSDAIACSNSQDFACYAWVYTSEGDEVTLDVVGDDGGSIDTIGYAGITTTDTGADGNTWYRMGITGAAGGADSTLQVRLERLTGDAAATTIFYVDKCYMRLGSTSFPDAWMSCRRTRNCKDNTAGRINYIDIEDIPGDTPAKWEWHLDNTSADDVQDYIVATNRRYGAPAAFYNTIDKDTVTTLALTDTSAVSNPIYSSGSYLSCDFAGTQTITSRVSYTLGKETYRGRHNVWLSGCDISPSVDTIKFYVRADFASGAYYSDSEEVSMSSVGSWRWQNCGLIDIPGYTIPEDETLSGTGVLYLMARRASGAGSLQWDQIYLIPTEVDALIGDIPFSVSDGDTIHIEDSESPCWVEFSGGTQVHVPAIGNTPQLEPSDFQRLSSAFHMNLANPYQAATAEINNTIIYKPRTEFLLGTA